MITSTVTSSGEVHTNTYHHPDTMPQASSRQAACPSCGRDISSPGTTRWNRDVTVLVCSRCLVSLTHSLPQSSPLSTLRWHRGVDSVRVSLPGRCICPGCHNGLTEHGSTRWSALGQLLICAHCGIFMLGSFPRLDGKDFTWRDNIPEASQIWMAPRCICQDNSLDWSQPDPGCSLHGVNG